MANKRKAEVMVGSFVLVAIIAFVILALKVSGLTSLSTVSGYQVTAIFDNVGDLRVRAPVRVAGVKVGEVSAIHLDRKTFRGNVLLNLDQGVKLPRDTSASIFTEGLLGSNYVSLTPGFDDKDLLKQGSVIQDTHPAIILENLIGQFMFSISNKSK